MLLSRGCLGEDWATAEKNDKTDSVMYAVGMNLYIAKDSHHHVAANML